MKLPFPDNSFDGVYAIEATCHAPSRVGVYSEIFRVLKPGGIFATYEWCLTDKYDKDNAEHCWIKKAIEEGDGLPDMCHTSLCTKAVEKCGFELLEARDAAEDPNPGGEPWFWPLTPSWLPWKLPGFQFNPIIFRLFPPFLSALEAIRVVPQGTSKTQVMLQAGGVGCQKGGATGVSVKIVVDCLNGRLLPWLLCLAGVHSYVADGGQEALQELVSENASIRIEDHNFAIESALINILIA